MPCAYSGRDCSIGNSETYDWLYPIDGQSYFFLVVADDTTVEGSYGTDSAGVERGPDLGCEAQSLASRCN